MADKVTKNKGAEKWTAGLFFSAAACALLERVLVSPERAVIRAHVQRALALFDGHLSHIEYQVD